MRDTLVKMTMIAGAALLVTACGDNKAANTTNATVPAGDNYTTLPAGNDLAPMSDMNMSGGTMGGNTSTGTTGTTGTGTTGGDTGGNMSGGNMAGGNTAGM